MSITQPITQKIVPTTGSSVQLINSDNDLLVVCWPATDLAALTITMPSLPHAGEQIVFITSKNITAIILNGGTMDRTVTKMNAGDMFRYVYDEVDGVWIQTENSNAFDLSGLPRIYQGSTRKYNVIQVVKSATVASGTLTYYLTDTGAVGGNAIYPTAVFKESAQFWVEDNNNTYNFGAYTLSADRKTLTVTCSRLATTNANGLISLLGSVVSFVTGIVFTSAANGTVVYLSIMGN